MSHYTVVSKHDQQQRKYKLIRRLVSIFLVLVILSIFLVAWFYWRLLSPTILDIAQTRLKAETTFAINEAVCAALNAYADFSDFVYIEKDNQGEITMISANTAQVNMLAHSTAVLCQSKINALKSFDVEIPIGALSGISLLSEKGPTVNVVVSPVGKVSCNFESNFETAGINQTLHRIYINVQSRVDLIMPTSHVQVETVTPILLRESVIIGKVPDIFLQNGLVLGSS